MTEKPMPAFRSACSASTNAVVEADGRPIERMRRRIVSVS